MTIKYDVPQNWQLGFQDAGTGIMESIINFHNLVMIYISFIVVGVMYLLISICIEFAKTKRIISHKYLNHGTTIETIWTIFPAVILGLIALPSFKLLYLIDEVVDPGITIKVIGHQWYWSYEYSDYANQDGQTIQFDSYLVPTGDLETGDLRLLESSNEMVVPVNTYVRVIITAADVLHCWAVPSLGVKLDAVPGRLNQTGFLANRESTYYGSCSEICGAQHQGMPIGVKVVSLAEYCTWVDAQLSESRA